MSENTNFTVKDGKLVEEDDKELDFEENLTFEE
jgi:hypothetical protein